MRDFSQPAPLSPSEWALGSFALLGFAWLAYEILAFLLFLIS